MGVNQDGCLNAASLKMIYEYGAYYGMGGMTEIKMGSLTGINHYSISNMKIEMTRTSC